jgi:hypothetical protein
MNIFEENPFDLTKASDFSDSEIYDYWVDITAKNNKGLIDLIKPHSVMPMMLLGSKGCGKTHLMRYCSEPVQLMRNNNDIILTIKKDKYLGIYFRADALNSGRFYGKGQDIDKWYPVFSYYFELWLSLCLLEIVNKIIKTIPHKQEKEIVTAILKLINNKTENIDTIDDLINIFEKNKKDIDRIVNNCAITRKLEDFDIMFSPGDILFGIPEILNKKINILNKTLFLYLIDEIENFNEMQQKFINTLIRYRRGFTSIKIGARLYGIKTLKTHSDEEKIREGAEFEKIEFDKIFRNENNYALFIKNLIIKRLEINNMFLDKTININNYFEEIDSDNYFSKETLKIVSTRGNNPSERIYFSKLKENILKYTEEKRINTIITNLVINDYPLLEKINIFIFYKYFLKQIDLVVLSENIRDSANLFISSNKQPNLIKYYQKYQHFNNDMLAQLYRDYKRNIPYAGLTTIIHLSQGSPRNTLGILKNIYRRAKFNGEKPFQGEKISIKSQTEGITDTAEWFWDDVQPDNNGIRIRTAIENLSVFFRNIRYCFKPTECDLSSFSVNLNTLSDEARETIINAENWSFIVRLKRGRNSKNSQEINTSFQLAPILTPRWGLSQRRGGTIELSSDFANAIFGKSKEIFKNELDNRLKNVSFEFKKVSKKQIIDDEENGYYNGDLFNEE